MTSSAELLWTAEAWAKREASGNPVYPYEWEIRYRDGRRFLRVCNGQARLSAQAPRQHIQALRVVGPVINWVEVFPSAEMPDAIVVQARVVRPAGRFGIGGIAWWRFGFTYAGEFLGITLDPYGHVLTPPQALHQGRNGVVTSATMPQPT